jgi:16S rRNA C1402 N4-methylase RsmH
MTWACDEWLLAAGIVGLVQKLTCSPPIAKVQDHKPVLYQEILDLLEPQPGGKYIDGTLGAGGHTTGLLTASAPDGRVLAFERDADAISLARERLRPFGERVAFV